jgi:lipopolysaccharide transport system ATP-binding protein
MEKENVVINTKNLSKVYQKNKSGKHGLFSSRYENIFALKNISIKVCEGEVIGIIGANGSGKSTLLKLLSEVTVPTEGSINIKGKVLSALEIGIGFLPELTGRENVILNGKLLGMSTTEIRKKLNDIIEFSGIGDFIDNPVKHFSSGMYNRLAFSVIVFLEGDILLLDEVLSTGDREFRIKAHNKIKELKSKGKTFLIVSHSLSEIMYLCNRVIWLENGAINKEGNPTEIISEYQARAMFHSSMLTSEFKTDIPVFKWESGDTVNNTDTNVFISQVSVSAINGCNINTVSDISISIKYKTFQLTKIIDVGFTLYDSSGYQVFAAATDIKHESIDEVNEPFEATFLLPGNLLNAGAYKIELFTCEDKMHVIPYMLTELAFFVNADPDQKFAGLFPGPIKPKLKWKVNKVSK